MIKASVSQTKNGLSGLLAEVRRGETVLIMHRVDRFLATARPRLADGLSVSELVAEERGEGP